MTTYVILVVLLGFSAFFSGSETALFSLSRECLTAWASSRNPFRRLVTRLVAEPRKLLVTVLLGNLLVNVTFYAVASAKALSFARNGQALAGAVFGILTPVVVIVFGEVAPKTFALGFRESVATATAPALYVLKAAVLPLRVVVAAIARTLGNLLSSRHPRQVYVTPEELKMLINTSEGQGVIDRNESIMMQELVDFGKVMVRDVMVPRVDMVTVSADAPREEFVRVIRDTRHSSIVVIGSSVDDITGIVHSREVLLEPDRPVAALVHPPYFVPETKSVESLLGEFREKHLSLAMVVDEYGGTAGLVTLEDVVESIVGDIHDEYDRPEPGVEDLGGNRYLCSGRLGIADWTEMFGLSVSDRRLTTLSGLVIRLLGHLPRVNEQVRYGNLMFTVKRVERHSVEDVLVEYVAEDAEAAP